jgi:DNA repair ATPase RecN
MLELEIQKLTAAIETLTKVVQEMARPTLVVTNGIPTNVTNLEEAEKAYRELEKADRSYHEDDVVREALQAERTAMMAKIDGVSNADHEQAKTKRKAKVTKEEVEALVEAVTEESSKSPEPEKIAANITAEDLKTVAMEIARADSSARPLILSILSEHGAKTITQLDPKHYREVHGRLMSIAYDIAKNGEVTQ